MDANGDCIAILDSVGAMISTDEIRANGNLIQHSPELLDATKRALQFIESLIGLKAVTGPTIESLRETLKSAIAKATGK